MLLLPPGPPRLALPAQRSARLDTVQCIDALRFLEALPSNYVNCIVTSPPYFGLRDYGITGQIGLEASLEAFIERLVVLFREARRVLRDDGVLWLNLGDSYSSGGRTSQVIQTLRYGQIGTNIRPPVVKPKYRLRSDLTSEEVAYVLSELAKTV